MRRNPGMFGVRTVMVWMDLILMLFLLAAGAVSAGRLGTRPGDFADAMICLAIYAAYAVIEPLSGASPAKWLFGWRVTRSEPSAPAAAWTRAAVKHVPLLMMFGAMWDPLTLRRQARLSHSQWTILTTSIGLLGGLIVVISARSLRRGRRTLHDAVARTDVQPVARVRATEARQARGFALMPSAPPSNPERSTAPPEPS